MKRTWKTEVLGILLTESIGAFSGWLARDGIKIYSATVKKPCLSPPDFIFPIVWGILFALMGIGAARIYKTSPSRERSWGLWWFGVQLGFNFLWSIFFFQLQAFAFALLWLVVLWGLILKMVFSFRKIDKTAAWLQIPYLVWVTFAAYLNLGVWLLNPA